MLLLCITRATYPECGSMDFYSGILVFIYALSPWERDRNLFSFSADYIANAFGFIFCPLCLFGVCTLSFIYACTFSGQM